MGLGIGLALLLTLVGIGAGVTWLSQASGGPMAYFFGISFMIVSVLAGVVVVIGVCFWASLFLLAVDVGRNLRAIRRNTSGL